MGRAALDCRWHVPVANLVLHEEKYRRLVGDDGVATEVAETPTKRLWCEKMTVISGDVDIACARDGSGGIGVMEDETCQKKVKVQ